MQHGCIVGDYQNATPLDSLSSTISAMSSAALVVSRLPVGSSAITSLGDESEPSYGYADAHRRTIGQAGAAGAHLIQSGQQFPALLFSLALGQAIQAQW